MGDLTLGVEGLREGIKGRDSALPIILGVWCRRGTKYENWEEI